MAQDVQYSQPVLYVFLSMTLSISPDAFLHCPVASREQCEAENDPSTPLETVAEGERLVRIPLEELQQGNGEKQ